MVKIVFTFILFTSLQLQAQAGRDALLGKWITTDKSVAVQVYQHGDDFKAKIIWIDEKLGSGLPMHARTDSRNPNEDLRKRKIMGMNILEGLRYNADTKRWENGKIYDASSGRIWDAFAELKSDGRLFVRGFWKFSWIGKTLHFKRW